MELQKSIKEYLKYGKECVNGAIIHMIKIMSGTEGAALKFVLNGTTVQKHLYNGRCKTDILMI